MCGTQGVRIPTAMVETIEVVRQRGSCKYDDLFKDVYVLEKVVEVDEECGVAKSFHSSGRGTVVVLCVRHVLRNEDGGVRAKGAERVALGTERMREGGIGD